MSAPTRSHGRISVTATAAPRALGPPPLAHPVWTARVLTLFPEVFPGPLGASLTGRALQQRIWALEAIDIRRFATDRHRTVDGPPAGGGPGMVMRADVLAPAIRHAMAGTPADRADWPLIALSPRGRPLDQARARALAAGRGVTLLCGRFEGIDQRVLDAFDIEEVGVGDAVLTGGEIPAMALLDAAVRLIPRVLGNPDSAEEESFSAGLLEHPQYTKPAVWEGRAIPEVLLSGHHARVADWRRAQAEALTQERRPDLRGARGHAAPDPRGPEPSVAHTSAENGGPDEEGAGT